MTRSKIFSITIIIFFAAYFLVGFVNTVFAGHEECTRVCTGHYERCRGSGEDRECTTECSGWEEQCSSVYEYQYEYQYQYPYPYPYEYQYQYPYPYPYPYQYPTPYNSPYDYQYEYQYQYQYQTPSVDIKANSSNGPINISWNTSANLSWTSSNVSSCNASGDWSGGKPLNGSESTGNLNQVRTYNYTIACTGGSASDNVQVTVNAPIPNNPSNLNVAQPNYCVSGPAATVTWNYSDPSGSPQQSYQVQIDDQGSFASPEVDSGKVNSGSTSFFSGQGYMQFNTTYRARVRVWNGYDVVSDWTVSSSFKTPNFAYPQVNFTWTQSGFSEPMNPQLNEPIQFTDQTVFGGNPVQREWDWLFGDGTSSTQQNPTKTYSAEGSYYVTLTAEDSQGQVCSRTKGPLNVQKPIPVWKEVAPK